MNKNSLLKICDLTSEEIFHILEDAATFSNSQSDWQSPHKTLVANLFFEPSTRTHFSLASAEHQSGTCMKNFTVQGSSVEGGENLYDMVKTFGSIGYSVVVIRHSQDECFKELENIQIPILNAGDGCGNHPTQCLLDLLTIYQEFQTFQGIEMAVISDITHSHVADSIKEALGMLGGEITLSGPDEQVAKDVYYKRVDEAVQWADVVMMLHIQYERHEETMVVSRAEYLECYGLTKQRAVVMQPHIIIMRPVPVNRSVEVGSDLVGAGNSRISKQMSDGVLMYRAVTKRVLGYEFK